MKTQNKKFAIIAVFAALMLNFSTAVFANDDKKNSNIELSFIGTREANSIFQLKLANVENDEFSVIFRDSYGNVLYADKIKGTNITQKFLLSSEEINAGVIKVEVRSRKSNKSEVFTINKSTRFVEETTVSKN